MLKTLQTDEEIYWEFGEPKERNQKTLAGFTAAKLVESSLRICTWTELATDMHVVKTGKLHNDICDGR